MRVFLSNVPGLSDVARESLEAPISLKEIEDAIDSLSAHKSPGPYSIIGDFYRPFKIIISPFFLKLFRYAYKVHMLSPSFTRTHTVLIQKSDDTQKLQSVAGYKCITLYDVDYKVYDKIFTTRI